MKKGVNEKMIMLLKALFGLNRNKFKGKYFKQIMLKPIQGMISLIPKKKFWKDKVMEQSESRPNIVNDDKSRVIRGRIKKPPQTREATGEKEKGSGVETSTFLIREKTI